MATDPRRIALITGGTSGIGAAFADRLAQQGLHLILTGRRREKIEALAAEFAGRHSVQVQVVIADLARDDDLAALAELISPLAGLEVLVNNAGFGTRGAFREQPSAPHEAMLKVHALATMRLTHAALPAMLANHRGSIINVSSLAAFFPLPQHATYSATKAFVRYFSESLSLELRGTGVRVQALCPGFTRTDFHTRIGMDADQVYRDRGPLRTMSPQQVVDASLRCLQRGQVICVPGFRNRIASVLPRLLPRSVLHKMLLSIKE